MLEGSGANMKRNCGEGSCWGWSGAFEICHIGAITLQCRHVTEPMVFKLVRAEIKLIGNSAFIVFQEENERYSSYRIENQSSFISISAY